MDAVIFIVIVAVAVLAVAYIVAHRPPNKAPDHPITLPGGTVINPAPTNTPEAK